jgi:hypothetical protein
MESRELDHGDPHGGDWFHSPWFSCTCVATEERTGELRVEFLNFKILKSPLNWFTIVLMVLIAGILLHIVLSSFGASPAKAIDPTQNQPGS